MNSRTNKILRGVWPPLLIETRPDGRIDFGAVTAAARHFAAAGVHGLYTADTASEFYTMEFEEWNDLAVHTRQVLRDCAMASGIGCTWTNQAGALRRIARARELGYDHIHLSQPYWIRLNEPAQKNYWKAVADVAGDLPIVVYAGSQGQFVFDGPLLRRLCDICPSIVGTKASGYDAVVLNSFLVHCPESLHFVGEQVFTSAIALGAAGCFSALVGLCPRLVLDWYDLMVRKDWAAAFEIQRRVNRFYEDGAVPARRAGFVMDKALAVLGGIPGATRTGRPPYAGLPDDLFKGLEAAALRHLPEYAASLAARGK